jgi:hypothetical protein
MSRKCRSYAGSEASDGLNQRGREARMVVIHMVIKSLALFGGIEEKADDEVEDIGILPRRRFCQISSSYHC